MQLAELSHGARHCWSAPQTSLAMAQAPPGHALSTVGSWHTLYKPPSMLLGTLLCTHR
jgi:hypothetical protein